MFCLQIHSTQVIMEAELNILLWEGGLRMRGQTQAKKILVDAYNACRGLLDIRDAYLYGSYARGDYHDASDIDILMTANASDEDIRAKRKQIASIVSDLSLDNDITVSLTVKPIEQFVRYSSILPYYKNVLKEGIRYPL